MLDRSWPSKMSESDGAHVDQEASTRANPRVNAFDRNKGLDGFPGGHGCDHVDLPRGQRRNKDVFMAGSYHQDQDNQLDLEDEVHEAMEAVVDDLQTLEGIDDEEILDAHESYAEIRKKIVEKKKARG